jgi:hypothetical protein
MEKLLNEHHSRGALHIFFAFDYTTIAIGWIIREDVTQGSDNSTKIRIVAHEPAAIALTAV